jgi:hypothetical protein
MQELVKKYSYKLNFTILSINKFKRIILSPHLKINYFYLNFKTFKYIEFKTTKKNYGIEA